MKRGVSSTADVATTLTSAAQQTASSSVSTAAATDVRFTADLTSLRANDDQLRGSLPFCK